VSATPRRVYAGLVDLPQRTPGHDDLTSVINSRHQDPGAAIRAVGAATANNQGLPSLRLAAVTAVWTTRMPRRNTAQPRMQDLARLRARMGYAAGAERHVDLAPRVRVRTRGGAMKEPDSSVDRPRAKSELCACRPAYQAFLSVGLGDSVVSRED
jgi:hypothetical protein